MPVQWHLMNHLTKMCVFTENSATSSHVFVKKKLQKKQLKLRQVAVGSFLWVSEVLPSSKKTSSSGESLKDKEITWNGQLSAWTWDNI